MIRFRRGAWCVLLASLLAVVPAPAQSDEPAPAEEPKRTGIEEQVQVTLVEIKIRVADKDGQPITDLRPEEIEVFEGGERQKLAYLEPLALRGTKNAIQAPVPVYDAEGDSSQGRIEMVVPPKPVRRIVFTFDPRNSRIPMRDSWKEAALNWIREHLRPEDRAAVVKLSTYPEWQGPFTGDSNVLLGQLSGVDLHTNIPDRNRRNEISTIVDEFSGLCADHVGRSRLSERMGTRAGDISQDDVGCAYEVSRAMSAEWGAQSHESFDVLRALTGQLAALPGEKIMVLFSEGIVDDPAQVLVDAMLSVFNYEKVDVPAMLSRLDRGTSRELTDLQETALASDVVIYPIDTRHPNEGSDFGKLERTSTMTTGSMGTNPWGSMYNATTATLDGLANATGGRFFYGPDDLEQKIANAADSFYGIYSLGYYRNDPQRIGKVRVKVDRKRVDLQYDEKPRRPRYDPSPARVDLVVGRPRPVDDNTQALPLSLVTPLEQLPLRPGGGGRGCEVGVFVQAVSPDGEIVAESFETVTVVLSKEEFEENKGKNWQHILYLWVPQGPLRVRARLSDDRQVILADASIDLTVVEGNVLGGLRQVAAPDVASQEGS